MTPPLFRLFHSVSKPGETDRLLKTLVKSPAVSLFQRFQGVLAANFKITSDHLPEFVKQRNRQHFPSEHQGLVCFTPFWNRLKQAHQGKPKP